MILRVNTPMTLPEKSTSSRLPYEYDALMGITRVGTKEAEGFEEEVDTTEYHDAAEEPVRKEETDDPQLELRSMGFQGGYGSSPLKECCPCSTRLWGRSKVDRSFTGYEPKHGRSIDRSRCTTLKWLN